jgi:hypothetical protein
VTIYSEPVGWEGQVVAMVPKHVIEDVSQQLIPLTTAGQLFWQSESWEHWATHAVPPPPELVVAPELMPLLGAPDELP